MNLINTRNLYGDGIGYIGQYNFSQSNTSEEARIHAVTSVASVCYQNPNAVGSLNLYNRLATENKGLPSSSYEFVPVLLTEPQYLDIPNNGISNCEKYGEWVEPDINGNKMYLLTNLRALIADVGDKANEFFNTEEECDIIAKNFKVFQTKIPLFVARQYMRHRSSWQELSRRYVSDKRKEFEFYTATPRERTIKTSSNETMQDLISKTVDWYHAAIKDGLKPENARMMLPQNMYTTVWSAWMPSQLDIFLKLRLDEHTQKQTRELARMKKELLGNV